MTTVAGGQPLARHHLAQRGGSLSHPGGVRCCDWGQRPLQLLIAMGGVTKTVSRHSHSPSATRARRRREGVRAGGWEHGEHGHYEHPQGPKAQETSNMMLASSGPRRGVLAPAPSLL